MPRRPENWTDLLTEHIDRYREKAFIWGTSDCTRFIAEWLDLVRGTSYVKKIPKRYKTEKGAYKALIRHYKVKNLVELVTRELGDPYSTPLYAQRGDIIGSEVHPDYSEVFGCALGICTGPEIAFFGPSTRGIVLVPFRIDVIKYAWRV